MSVVHSNNYRTALTSSIVAADTTITLDSVTKMPTIGGGATCYLTIQDGSTFEIVTATSRTGSVVTVTRGAQSTTASDFPAGSIVFLGATADDFDRKTDGAASSTDNAIARFDGTTGKVIQNSVVTIADSTGNMAGVGTINTHTIPGGTGTIALTSDLPNTFSTIAVSGQSNVVADSTTDTLTLVAGTNVTITTNAGTDTITIAASGGGGGGGGWTFIGSATVGTAITTGLTGYDTFVIVFSGGIAAGGGNNFRLYFSTDGGSTYGTLWNQSIHILRTDSTTATIYDTGAIGTSYLSLNGNGGSSATTDPHSAVLYCHNLSSTSLYKTVIGDCGGFDNSGSHYGWQARVFGTYNSTSAVTALKIVENSGATTGTYRIYGIPNS
jgi:hypothetical protein